MGMNENTLTIALLVVGLLVGVGAGYMMAPQSPVEEDIAPTQEVIYEYQPSWVSWLALVIGTISLVASGGLWFMIVGGKQ